MQNSIWKSFVDYNATYGPFTRSKVLVSLNVMSKLFFGLLNNDGFLGSGKNLLILRFDFWLLLY